MPNLFNNTQKPTEFGSPVPAGVVAPMVMRVKRDPYTGDILTQSQSSASQHLNCEVKLADGDHKGGMIFARLTIANCKPDVEQRSRDLIASIVRSACGLAMNDMSKNAESVLLNFDYEQLDGARFIGQTGRVERGKLKDPTLGPDSERWDDRSTLATGVTPDMPEWKEWKDAPRGLGLNGGGSASPSAPPPSSVEAPPPWAD